MKTNKIYATPILRSYEIEDSFSSASARIYSFDSNEQIIESGVKNSDKKNSFTW